jgi:aminoglycoside phosphotransferase (APT) family kinase protein
VLNPDIGLPRGRAATSVAAMSSTAASQPVLIEPLPPHRLDEAALFACLRERLDGFGEPARVRQFQGGQSNPTYLIETPDRRFVLRKKPPGPLLPSAHQVEREHRVLSALAGSGVPAPRTRLLIEDPSVIGTAFYVMDFVGGRVLTDTTLSGLRRDERRPTYEALATTLAALHRIDWRARGLSDFGKADRYCRRQVDRWTKQYQAARIDDIPAMESLTAWLNEHPEPEDEGAVVHGDFRLGNVIWAEDRPEIVAVLDWELATLGHPLADLAYLALPYHLPAVGPMPGIGHLDLAAENLPPEAEFLETYRRAVGRADVPHWPYFLALSLFRLAGICQGVYARALAGNAADRSAHAMAAVARGAADLGWAIASGARPVAA